MATSTLTSKGQMTLPKAVRERLNLKEGDRLDVLIENDRIVLVPITFRTRDLVSLLPKPKRRASLETMDRTIRRRAAERAH